MLISLVFLTSIFILYPRMYSCLTVNSKCLFPDHNVIHKGMDWIQTIAGEIYETKDTNETFLYTIGICTTPNISVETGNLKFASVLQKNLKTNDNSLFVIGRYNDTDIKLGTNWGFLEFGSGDRYTSHCSSDKRTAMVMITCNQNIGKPILKIIEENNQKNSKCYYLFELEHPKMCSNYGSLGTASIFIIIIVSLIVIYFCIGMAIKMVFYKAEGVELIPNIMIWRSVGESFSNCIEKFCRPKPFHINYERCQPFPDDRVVINDLEPGNFDNDDDEALVLP